MSEKSAFRRCGRDLVEFFNNTGWALGGKLACRALSVIISFRRSLRHEISRFEHSRGSRHRHL